jgi:16S rRNA (guanine527-N7)-methyltransferase
MFHVKHTSDSEPIRSMSTSDVLECLSAVGASATEDQARVLLSHALAVLDSNKAVNLTRVTDPEQVLRLHIGDSATALPYVLACPPGMAADIGSGAGYPGVVLSVLAKRKFVLVESVGKKANFLRKVVDELDLDIGVENTRAEELAVSRPGAFSCVVARAVSSLAALVELASPLLAVGGRLICMKGSPDAEEIAAGGIAASMCGMQHIESETLELPGGQKRTMVVYERRGRAREQLPRRPGMAQRHPLC